MKHQTIKPAEDVMSRSFAVTLMGSILVGLAIWAGIILLLF